MVELVDYIIIIETRTVERSMLLRECEEEWIIVEVERERTVGVNIEGIVGIWEVHDW